VSSLTNIATILATLYISYTNIPHICTNLFKPYSAIFGKTPRKSLYFCTIWTKTYSLYRSI